MKYFIAFLLIAIIWLVGTSLYMYDIKNDGHNHADITSPKFENVVVDAKHAFLGLDPDQVVCYRESHRNFYIFTLVLMAAILGLVAYGFIIKSTLSRSLKKKNLEIESQKSVIETSNQNLISSLHYASRVQNAFLPSQQMLANMFSDHFVLNKPRDIVSGDFYWASKVGNKKVVCLGDCTGHGVPAALLTMNAFNILNQLVSTLVDTPSDLMNAIHTQLISNLDKENENEDLTDGMDLSILIYDQNNGRMEFVSAHQSVFVYDGQELSEWKGERRGLGLGYREMKNPFTVHSFDIKKGSTVYAFSDGVTDQFGGPENRKFSKKKFQELIRSVCGMSITEQKERIFNILNEWKTGVPQTDDMLLVAIHV